MSSTGFDMIAVGTSAGGFEAICRIMTQLPAEFEIPITVVQHRAKESHLLAGLLQDCAALRVSEVEDKQPVEPGHIYIAPPDYHLLIDEGEFALSTEGPVGFSRPSIDVFFQSVADAYRARAIGVVLTGANADGSNGLRAIAASGGRAIVQDPASAEVAVMPASALQAVKRALVMTLDEIAAYLIRINGLQREKPSEQVIP